MKTSSRFTKLALAAMLAAVISILYAISGLFMQENIQLPTMRTHCIGRYLIDLPEEYTMTPGSELKLYYGLGIDFETVNIQHSYLSDEQSGLSRLIRKTVANLEADEHFESPSKNMLVGVKEINRDLILVQSYDSAQLTDYFRFHLYAQKGQALIRLEGFNYPRANITSEYVESRLLRIAQNTHFFDAPEKADKGSCLGSVTIDDKQDGEMFILAFLSKEHPDIILNIDMSSLPEKGDGGLLKRVDSKAGMLQKLDFSATTLRKGKRQIAGRPGEELLDAGEQEGKVQRYFVAETLVTEPSSLTKPVIAISMNMGGQNKDGEYVDPSLSEKEALAWWDAIVSSIRYR